jgi:hypothetical protein
LAAARDDFERAKADYDRAEAARQEWVHEQTSRYETALPARDTELARHNSRIAQIASGLRNRDRESVQRYLELALSRSCSQMKFRTWWRLPTRRRANRLSSV